MDLKLKDLKIFDVLRNTLNSELGVVMGISGDHLSLRGKTGAVVSFKFGKHFERVDSGEAVDFRALARAAAKAAAAAVPVKGKKRRTLAGFLSRLAKKR